MRNVSVKTKYGRPNLEFNPDGNLKYVELDIMNLNNIGMWDKVCFMNFYCFPCLFVQLLIFIIDRDVDWPGNWNKGSDYFILIYSIFSENQFKEKILVSKAKGVNYLWFSTIYADITWPGNSPVAPMGVPEKVSSILNKI